MQTQENVFYCLNISCFILLPCVVLNLNSASFDDVDHCCYHHHFIGSTIIIIITFISVNFYFPFVSNSLAYITIPQNNGKMKINCDKNLVQHICVFFLLHNPLLILNLNTSLLSLNTASFDDDDDDDDNDDHYYYCYHDHFISNTIIIIIIIIIIVIIIINTIIFLLRKRVFFNRCLAV